MTSGAMADPGRPDPGRLLATPLGPRILGLELCADLYLRNGFRLLGLPASVSGDALERELQRFRNLSKMDPAAALRASLRTGSEEHVRLQPEDVREAVARFAHARRRIVMELFWPHLGPELFAPVQTRRDLAASEALGAISEIAAGNGRPGTLARHALAVIHHNRALAAELAALARGAEPSDEPWTLAQSYWADVLESRMFWDYVRERAESLDDPSLTPRDLEPLRTEVPAFLLAFHGLFARTWAQAGDAAATSRHLRLISGAAWPEPVRQDSLRTAGRGLIASRLEPLSRRVDAELLGRNPRLRRQTFAAVCAPILAEAQAVCTSLARDAGLPPEVLAGAAELDGLGEKISRALDQSLDYSGDDSGRSILYSLLVVRRLLALPLSPALRQKLETSLRRDTRALYGDFLPKAGIDPTRCWFLATEEPDPDASLELPVYKIADRTVECDFATGRYGLRVSCSTRRVLVPRSVRARDVHSGRLRLENLPEEDLDTESRSLARQIRSAEAKLEKLLAKERRACEEELAAEEATAQAEIQQHDQRTAAQTAENQRRLAEIDTRLKQQLAEETRRSDGEIAAARARGRQAIAQEQSAAAAVTAANRGLLGAARAEIPAMALLGGLLAAAGFGLDLAGVTLAGEAWTSLPVLAGLIGAVCGLVLGGWVRAQRRNRAAAAVEAARQAANQEETRLSRESKGRSDALRQEAKRAGAKPRSRLDAITAERRKLQEQSERRKQDVRRQHDRASDDAKRASADNVSKLRRRLEERVHGKPESAKADFPAYRQALAAGFKPGTKPTSQEMELTWSERQEAEQRFLQRALIEGRFRR